MIEDVEQPIHAQANPRRVLVVGASRPFGWVPDRQARMIGVTLARAGFGLVTGNDTGVGRWAAETFWSFLERSGIDPTTRYQQVYISYWKNRGGFWPGHGFRKSGIQRIEVKDNFEWIEAAVDLCNAAIMIGGRRGSLRIARRFIDRGKTVLPIPFTEGRSDDVFQEILRTWCASPVPGLSQAQFLTLALPWISDTGPVENLLRAIFAESPDIFVSYRRSDVQAVGGRLYEDLVDHFGRKRVFMDIEDIQPGASWDKAIDGALESCRVGIVVIGPSWISQRLNDPEDVLRREIRALLDQRKVVIPLLVEGAQLPATDDLPADLRNLPTFQAGSIHNDSWSAAMERLVGVIDSHVRKDAGPV